ncbi:RICIN domain-containing protein [Streptomyces xanthophaeus]|uniref:RICIN domain-containing protein n=1 Tax=Streptomyces xanthophaeus TaxID=67385 RepID=UPI0026474FB9|nr:RICIN domain-containing protein [Streptomyces xanthophaeus]WKD36861.1 RICIN domain-containing protein [Streptomyces xanthophaeus]
MSDGGRDDGRRGDTYHGPSGVQRGSGNLQVNFHEHRAGIVSACAVALVCVATVIAVRVGGGDPDTDAAAPPPGSTTTATVPAPRPGTGTADPSALTGRLVNRNSHLCLRVPGTDDGLVPVQDTCTGAADRTWTLAPQDGGGDTRTLRNAHSDRCLAVAGSENFAPARQLACTAARHDGQHWELQWGSGDLAGQFMLRNAVNAKCLTVQGLEAARPAAQISCGDQYDDQWWHLAP